MRSEQCVMRIIGGCRIRIRPGYDDPDLADLLRLSRAELRQSPNARVVREGRHALVLRIDRGPRRPALYWKEFFPRYWYDPLKELVNGSKGARAWDGSLRLQRVGLFTARLLAYGEAQRRSWLRSGRSFIITEEIEGAQSVAEFLQQYPANPTARDRRTKRLLVRELGHVAGRMHQAGLHHGDLRLNNVLWRPGLTGRPRLHLVDTDRVLPRMPLRERDIIRNLVQLNFFFLPGMSVTDRARLLTAYGEERLIDRETGRQIARATFRKLRRRLMARLRLLEKQPEKRQGIPEAIIQGMRELLRLITPPERTPFWRRLSNRCGGNRQCSSA